MEGGRRRVGEREGREGREEREKSGREEELELKGSKRRNKCAVLTGPKLSQRMQNRGNKQLQLLRAWVL
jgi:hypothetical protein